MLTRMCRTCLSLENIKNINAIHCTCQNVSVFEMLRQCCSVHDGEMAMSLFLCVECLKKLHVSYEFKQQTENVSKVYRNILESYDGTNDLFEDKTVRANDWDDKTHLKVCFTDDDPFELPKFDCEQSETDDSAPLAESINEDTKKTFKKRRKNRRIKNEQFDKTYECKICSETFDKAGVYAYHKRKHIRINCTSCEKVFNTNTLLKMHVQSAHETDGPKYECDRCPQRFTLPQNLRRHILTTHDKKLMFSCDKCTLTYSTKRALMYHLRKHSLAYEEQQLTKKVRTVRLQTENITCDLCNREFRYRKNYQIHMRTHKDFRCAVCSEDFTSVESFRFHRNSKHAETNDTSEETKKPKYDCDQCQKSYISQYYYNEHMKYHNKTNAKYPCKLCVKQCLSRSGLNHHIMRVHTNESKPNCPILCAICGKSFKSKCFLMNHYSVHTGEKTLSCHYCDKKFRTNITLMVHERIHENIRKYNCDVCTKSFIQPQQLKSHLRTHTGERPYCCPYCNKKFALNGNLTVHKRIHTGETPYVCPVCGKGFNNSSARKKHVLAVHKLS